MMLFAGRTRELGRLRACLATATAGQPQTVLLEGPAGVGKSALLRRFAEELDPSDVLTASGDEEERRLPFGLLQQLVPVRRDWTDAFAAGADLLELLDRRTAGAVTVLLVDDVDLADTASAAALGFALRRLRADSVLVVLSVRDEEIARVPQGLLRLADAQDNHLRLDGLGDEDVCDLAVAAGHRRPAPRAAARIRRHTDGNPLYLRALLDELPDEALLDLTRPLPAPRSFAALVLGRLAMRSPEAQALALAAAVVADGSTADLIAAVAGIDAPAVPLEELDTSGLVRCRREGTSWLVEYLHPLVKAVVYDGLGPATRADLHSRAAGLLGGDQALLHRVAAATAPDAGLAGDLARAAEARHHDGAPLQAADLMLRAARLSPGSATADDRYQQAVNLLVIGGDLTTAKSLLPDLAGTEPAAHRFYLEAKIAWLSGRPLDAEALATRAWSHGERARPASARRPGRDPRAARQHARRRADGGRLG